MHDSLAAIHLGRPSLYLDNRLQLYLAISSILNHSSDDLYLARCLLLIKRKFDAAAAPSEAYLEAQIPHALQVNSASTDISLPSAVLYLSLHPLLTNLDMFSHAEIISGLSSRMLLLIITSASIVIDHFTQLNNRNSIISIWLSAERVLIAGAVWVASLIHQKHSAAHNTPSIAATSTLMNPIVKVSSLLASFAARWKAAESYVTAWNVLVDILWQII